MDELNPSVEQQVALYLTHLEAQTAHELATIRQASRRVWTVVIIVALVVTGGIYYMLRAQNLAREGMRSTLYEACVIRNDNNAVMRDAWRHLAEDLDNRQASIALESAATQIHLRDCQAAWQSES